MDGDTTIVSGRFSDKGAMKDAGRAPEVKVLARRGVSADEPILLSALCVVVVTACEDNGGATKDFGSFQVPRRGEGVIVDEDDEGSMRAATAEIGGGNTEFSLPGRPDTI